MFTRLTMLLAVCLLLSLFSIPDASACTGRPYATDYKNIDEFEKWVRATVIDRDDLGFNAILRVEAYYKGDGPRLLVVDRHPRALESVTSGRGYSNGCMGNGGGQRYRRGATGYFGLRPKGDGTYSDWIGGSAHFVPRDGVITYFEDFEWLEISESDFVAKLLAIGGREAPSEPIAAEVERYPLMRYLMVTTETGTRFQVNPDRSVTPVPDAAPLGVSPDGAHWVYRLDEDTLGFGRPYTSRHSPEITYFEEIPGRKFRFSNDSNLVAVWDSSQLSIYLFGTAGYNYRGGWMGLNRIASADLNTAGGFAPRIEWSADSTTLAWQDASGIWRWNLYAEDDPALVIAGDDCYLIDISSQGRYLRHGTARGWTLYDSLTGESYADALAAPGENVLLFINSDDEPIPPWGDGRLCAPPLPRNCALYIDTVFKPVDVTVYPGGRGKFGLLFCKYDGLCDSRTYRWNPSTFWQGYFWPEPEFDQERWRQYAFDPYYDRKAILYGGYRIDLESWRDMILKATDDLEYERQLDLLDLEGIVDSPIASIEWGQPIFYDAFMLTAAEYIPRTVTIAGGW